MSYFLVKTESGNPDYPCITAVAWDTANQTPIWDGFTQPTLGILQAAYAANIGNIVVIPDPVPVPPPVIAREIDARRLRLALLQLGHLATVEAAVASLGQAAIIDWEYATTIREDYPLAQALSSQLGLDVDAVFDLAETLL